MTLARALAVALSGVAGHLVEIEADLSAGLPGLVFTGLADTSVLQSRDRIRAALGNSGVPWPNRKITVALLPADLRKVGSRFDLALALAVLGCAEQIPSGAAADAVWIAELGLDGRLRPVRGVLPSVLTAQRAGVRRVVVSAGNAAEAGLVPGMDVRAAHDLAEVISWLRGEGPPLQAPDPALDGEGASPDSDLADVAGQATAKRALEVAAAGGHHLYLVGTPGAGKTMLAERMPGLLPALSDAAALEVTAVHSVAGLLAKHARLLRRAPLQAPHHTASVAALVGGGSHLARPGAISLAHHGVLFLDEAPEFSPRALDALRQPLESGRVVLHRGGGAVSYPARFQLVLAANPCPCAKPARACTCPPQARRRYQQRLSGPLLDRIDVRVQVEPVAHVDLLTASSGESSAEIAARVAAARRCAADRWRGTPWGVNAAVPGSVLRAAPWVLPRPVLGAAEEYLRRGEITARGFDRVLRLAWTLADLAGRTVPVADDVAEALYFRTGEGGSWAA
ncbi:MAG: YifB family Mg chelatase-like AAA ATPase [Actinomycetota bacterium]|nr:YifB family Mg chelatase-like AAA ATPase [Actinomycetota bacterium]